MASVFAERESLPWLAKRGRSLRAALDEVIIHRGWNRDKLKSFHTQTLQELLAHAYENIPFYREHYQRAGFHPFQFHDLHDLHAIPMVSKADFRAAGSGSLFDPKRQGASRLLSSSGSTGEPLRLYRDEAALWQFTARNTALFYDWFEGKPLGNVLYFIDLTPGSIDHALADLLRTTVMAERILPVNLPTADLVEAIARYQPEFVSSYPSTMRNVAVAMHRRGESYRGLKLIHVTSEMLDRGTRAVIGKAFPNAKIVETYTASEVGLIAYPCPAEGLLHIAEDGVLVEIVDANGQPTDGMGEIVVTDLVNRSTPIIRYRGLGDFCRWEQRMCYCGSIDRSIRQLEGRRTDSILLPSGEFLSPFTLVDSIEELPGIYQFQAVQLSATEFEVRIVRDNSANVSEGDIHLSVSKAIAELSGDVNTKVHFVANIPPAVGGHKVPLVMSRVGRPA